MIIIGFGETFKALSDPARREILDLLKERSMTAGDIASNFEISGATVSYHLSVLKKAGLVFESKKKNFVIYQLNTSVIEELMLWFADLGGKNDEK